MPPSGLGKREVGATLRFAYETMRQGTGEPVLYLQQNEFCQKTVSLCVCVRACVHTRMCTHVRVLAREPCFSDKTAVLANALTSGW